MTKDLKAKLTAVEASMRRWQTRLTRAHNAVAKLNRQRLRLQGQLASTPAVKPKPQIVHELETLPPKTNQEHDDLGIPAFLARTQADVERMAKERKSKEVADKKAMPLTGRAALDYIKPKRKKA